MQTKTIFFRAFLIVLLALVFVAYPNADDGGYAIGGAGPGGGFVFYDKGSASDGWQYLEVAPASTEWRRKLRGAGGEYFGTSSTSIGSGKTNTATMVAKLLERNEDDTAAQLCDGLIFGGKDDWFLPSKDELNEIYKNLAAKGKGDFDLTAGSFMSSSEVNEHHVWHQDFSTGNQYDGLEFGRVRAVRAF
jgi:hypothetical protein